MAETLGLTNLFDLVVARYTAESITVPHYFGWREPAKQRDGNRIIWVPGDPSGKLGVAAPPKYPGQRQAGKPLLNTLELFHCYIVGYDKTDPSNERKQYFAARLLYDQLVRVMYQVAHGTFTMPDSTWVTDKKEFRAGATILLASSVQTVQPEEPQQGVPANTGLIAGVEMLDLTEELRVPENHVPS